MKIFVVKKFSQQIYKITLSGRKWVGYLTSIPHLDWNIVRSLFRLALHAEYLIKVVKIHLENAKSRDLLKIFYFHKSGKEIFEKIIIRLF